MMHIKKIDKFIVASIFFVCLQALLIVKFSILQNFKLAYYFCYHAPILFAVAFYRKDIVMIRTLIIIGFIGQATWLLDYFSHLLFGFYVLGNSRFIARYHGGTYAATLLSHLFSTLLALALVWRTPLPKKTMKYAFLYFFIFYVLNIVHIIPESYNVNFVWEFEGFNVFPFNTELYLLYIIPLAILPGYYFQLAVKQCAP
jgi:hypothetical protein